MASERPVAERWSVGSLFSGIGGFDCYPLKYPRSGSNCTSPSLMKETAISSSWACQIECVVRSVMAKFLGSLLCLLRSI